MPGVAVLVSQEAVPELAARVNSPEMIDVLRHIQKAGFIMNRSNLDLKTATVLQRLAELGLVDTAYEEWPTKGQPSLWVSNGNGSRVLGYLTGIRAGPFYEVPSSELAMWLEEQGKDRWWNVDGDPLLTGRMPFPCPADELATELRKINRPLLAQANKEDVGAKGQPIGKDKLNDLVGHFANTVPAAGARPKPLWGEDRFLYLCWKGSPYDWLLVEDNETTDQFKGDESVTAR